MRAAAVMHLSRLGSLNALEQSKTSSFWRTWLGAPVPSADTVGRVCSLIDPSGIRQTLHTVYSRLKRAKAINPLAEGLIAAVIDGHESHASYRRHCTGCLKRTNHTKNGDRTQYYHRYVAITLVSRDMCIMLDAEPMIPGEDEISAANRLLDRVIPSYPRAFDIILGDALYADSTFFNHVLSMGKHAMAVLKDQRRGLFQDAEGLFDKTAPVEFKEPRTSSYHWDIEGFNTWSQVNAPVRVVKSVETQIVRRQIDQEDQQNVSNWMWVTTIPSSRASTKTVVKFGHRRWAIENEGFNELATRHHGDHVYKHHPRAMLVFWLTTMLCMNVFTAFYCRNLKPVIRKSSSMLHISRLIASELFASISSGPARAPT